LRASRFRNAFTEERRFAAVKTKKQIKVFLFFFPISAAPRPEDQSLALSEPGILLYVFAMYAG
jgi:hypothetical protein